MLEELEERKMLEMQVEEMLATLVVMPVVMLVMPAVKPRLKSN